MNEAPVSGWARLKWFLGWDSTPDDEIPDPATTRNAALHPAHEVWEGEGDYTGTIPERFQALDRAGYSLFLLFPGDEAEQVLTSLKEWQHDAARPTDLTFKFQAFDKATAVELPNEVSIRQAMDWMGWIGFHPANNLSDQDIRLLGIHRKSDLSFIAFLEAKTSYCLGSFRDNSAFGAHVPGVWRFRTDYVELQEAPTRDRYEALLESWALHEMMLLGGGWKSVDDSLAVVSTGLIQNN